MVPPLATARPVEEWEAVLAGPLDQDDGGGAFGELNEVHDEELDEGVVGASS